MLAVFSRVDTVFAIILFTCKQSSRVFKAVHVPIRVIMTTTVLQRPIQSGLPQASRWIRSKGEVLQTRGFLVCAAPSVPLCYESFFLHGLIKWAKGVVGEAIVAPKQQGRLSISATESTSLLWNLLFRGWLCSTTRQKRQALGRLGQPQ